MHHFNIEPYGAGFTITTRRDGSNPWGAGIEFPSEEAAQRIVRAIRVELLHESNGGLNTDEMAAVSALISYETNRAGSYLDPVWRDTVKSAGAKLDLTLDL